MASFLIAGWLGKMRRKKGGTLASGEWPGSAAKVFRLFLGRMASFLRLQPGLGMDGCSCPFPRRIGPQGEALGEDASPKHISKNTFYHSG